MNTKLKGVLQLLVILLVTAAVCVVAYTGIGGAKRGSAKNIRLGLDLAGGVSVTYEATKENPTAQEMKDTVYKMQMRVQNESTEASVYQEGNNRVTVDVPDVDDPQAVLDKLGKAGALEFVLYNNVKVGEDGKTATYDKKDVIIDGSMLKTAEAATQQDSTTGQSENVVKLSFNAKGTKKFKKVTTDHVGEQFSIIYDGEIVSSPVIREAIDGGEAVISGSFDEFSKAEDMASTLRIGALPLEGQEVPGDVQPADGTQQPAAGNSTGQTEAAGDPVAGQPAGGQTAENGVDARLAFDGQVQTETDGRQVQAEADGGRLQGPNAEKLSTDGQVVSSETAENSSQPGVDSLAELMKSDLFTKGDTRQLLRLFASKEFRSLLTEQMKENFLLKPEMVADKEEVEQFFTKLREQVSRLAQTVSEAGKAQTQLFTQTNQLRENLDFLHQLSQTMQYVQLPLRMAGQETTGDLYVYANKKGLTKEDSISAFLHLDMEHLGPVDVYVAMQNRKVNTHFYLQDDAMIDFIQAHIHLLNERLEQKGYQMQTEVSQKDTPSKVTEEMRKDQEEESVCINQYSFDVRA